MKYLIAVFSGEQSSAGIVFEGTQAEAEEKAKTLAESAKGKMWDNAKSEMIPIEAVLICQPISSVVHEWKISKV